jgi:hypothetical protein
LPTRSFRMTISALCWYLAFWLCQYGGKLDHALRLVGETCRGRLQPGLDAYSAVLDCVCRLCHKDPLRMPMEAEKFLVDMEANGIPRDAGTFRVLTTNFLKIHKTGWHESVPAYG